MNEAQMSSGEARAAAGTERAHAEEELCRAALAVSSARSEAVFRELVRYLATLLNVEMALIALPHAEEPCKLQMLAFWLDGQIRENFAYQLAGTPCETVLAHGYRFYPRDLCRLFPLHPDFAALGPESYAGFPLTDGRGQVLGLMSVVSRRPLPDAQRVQSILQIFAVRASAELERLRAEEVLRASEASYRAIFEAAEDAILIHDWDTNAMVDVNPKACETYGYSHEEMRHVTTVQLSSGVPPYTQEDALRHVAEAKSGRTVRFEWHRRNKDGSLHWDDVRLKSAVIGGKPRIVAFTREITERKHAEDVLRASEEQYRAIFDAATDALVLWNSELKRVDVNPAYERIYGFSRDEVLSETYPAGVSAEYAERRLDLVRRTLAGESCSAELESVRKDGTRIRVEVRTIPIRHRGQPHVLAMSRDITEQKRAAERLRESEERYRLLFEMESDAIILADADTLQHIDANRAALELYGYSREEMLALRSTDLSAEPEKTQSAMLSGTGTTRVPLRYHRKKDGTVFPVDITANFFEFKGRRIMLAAIRDIADRKRAEEERLRLEAQLRQAQKMEAIGQLTGGIAHDFNNILTGILGYVVLAGERSADLGDAKLGHYLEQAKHAAQRARDLIQQMLIFSRGQRGERRATKLAPLVRDSMQLLRSTLPSTIALHTDLDDFAPSVMIDPVQMEQVLLNLCINARDAMCSIGDIRVIVRLADSWDAVCASCREFVRGRFVELAVCDTGPGIAPEVMDRVFEPFFSTKEVGRGSGMGLAMAHGIVHDHGGHILIETGVRGTVFKVILASAETATEAAHAPDLPGGVARPRPRRLSGRVLVVEDERVVSEYMAELLSGWGLDVTVMSDAVEAHAWLAHDPSLVDAVVTDQTMPRMTGLQLARKLADACPALPVILYTGYCDAITDEDLRECGARGLLRKPVEPDALFELLQRHMRAPREPASDARGALTGC